MSATEEKKSGAKMAPKQESEQGQKFRASILLQPNLSTIEISIWTSLWTLGVIYSSYHVFLASRSKPTGNIPAEVISTVIFSFQDT